MSLLRFIPGLSRERLLGGLLAVGAVLTVALVLLGGFFAGAIEAYALVFYWLATILPAFGLVILIAGGYWLVALYDTGSDWSPTEYREEGATAAKGPVGTDLKRSLASAASSRYRCREHAASTQVEQILRDGAVRRVRARSGHDKQTAQQIVAAGEWTDDPIAAAFLSAETRYPLFEQVRGAVDPGQAYWRRVQRTLAEIEAQAAESTMRGENEP